MAALRELAVRELAVRELAVRELAVRIGSVNAHSHPAIINSPNAPHCSEIRRTANRIPVSRARGPRGAGTAGPRTRSGARVPDGRTALLSRARSIASASGPLRASRGRDPLARLARASHSTTRAARARGHRERARERLGARRCAHRRDRRRTKTSRRAEHRGARGCGPATRERSALR
jgi:hypothetical protein